MTCGPGVALLGLTWEPFPGSRAQMESREVKAGEDGGGSILGAWQEPLGPGFCQQTPPFLY